MLHLTAISLFGCDLPNEQQMFNYVQNKMSVNLESLLNDSVPMPNKVTHRFVYKINPRLRKKYRMELDNCDKRVIDDSWTLIFVLNNLILGCRR